MRGIFKKLTAILLPVLITGIAVFTGGCSGADKPIDGDVNLKGDSYTANKEYWPTEDWKTSTPEEQGMDSNKLQSMFKFFRDKQNGIHSVLIVRNGYIVGEEYFEPYTKETASQIFGCTGSITSALAGMAIRDGYIKGTEQKVLELFPDLSIANVDSRKRDITVKQLLTMTSGFEWPEFDYTYDDKQNPLRQMLDSEDWNKSVLERPLLTDPGKVFNYNSGGMQLISSIIANKSGMSTLNYAQENLFKPLGIKAKWSPKDSKGANLGNGGIEMTPRDLAKIGYLYLKNGMWDGQEIIPSSWVEESTSVQYDWNNIGVGYNWWIEPNIKGYCSVGGSNQSVIVMPDLKMVVVFTGELQGVNFIQPFTFTRNFIIPAVNGAK